MPSIEGGKGAGKKVSKEQRKLGGEKLQGGPMAQKREK